VTKDAARNFDSATLFYDHGKKPDATRMSKRAFNHSDGWGPRLRLRRPTSVLVIKCTTLLTCIENSYCPSWNFSLQTDKVF
jgi:hypothetical protein